MRRFVRSGLLTEVYIYPFFANRIVLFLHHPQANSRHLPVSPLHCRSRPVSKGKVDLPIPRASDQARARAVPHLSSESGTGLERAGSSGLPLLDPSLLARCLNYHHNKKRLLCCGLMILDRRPVRYFESVYTSTVSDTLPRLFAHFPHRDK